MFGASLSVANAADVPATQPLGGPLVAGVCLLSQEMVFAGSKVGKAATARLKEISDLAQSEVNADRAQIQFDAKAIESQRGSLKPEEYQQKQQSLSQRLSALEQKANLRTREIEATRQKVVGRIALEAQPLVADIYKDKACGLLFNRNVVMGGNFGNDLTSAVVSALDAKMTTITFDRETLSPTAIAAK
jgi:Skp family chaperone for outer membrane proteins